ncbi:phytolongin Phyl2.2 [Sesamum indicum]|uniref:Phytolongin Phyl2.2 n=1 Tax=Sesamum indicum TaxID=4182 RepID=A0A8M8V561_SESIN|nr:phytolongin Phyl2.2 [Sesamum indicum]
MIMDPDLIHYACIAKGTTVLAEFNSKDAALGEIAAKCLEVTPPFHATFTHTVRSRTYTFLIEDPFVFFAIFDEKMESAERLAFLKSVRDAFAGVAKSTKNLKSLNSHCFQGEFNPVFRQLLGLGLDRLEYLESPTGQRLGPSGILHSDPVMGTSKPNCEKGLTKMKNRLLGELNIGRRNGEKKEDDDDGGKGIGLSREFSLLRHKNGYSAELSSQQKAKKVWKKQVWVILSLDLIICVILFAVWLWVCSGFKCMDS